METRLGRRGPAMTRGACINCGQPRRSNNPGQFCSAVACKRTRWAEWRAANRQKASAYVQGWKKRYPERHVAYQQRRRARAAQAGGSFSGDDITELLQAQRGRCFYCPQPLASYHVEHRVPLSRGGSNDRSNIVLACPPCNLSKGRKTDAEFAGGENR